MPIFFYRGQQGQQPCQGQIEAANRAAALTALRRANITPVELDVVQEKGSAAIRTEPNQAKSVFFSSAIKSKEITAMTRQLATLTSAGFPLARALVFVQRQATKDSLYQLLRQLDQDVRSGSSLSAALRKQSRYFNALYLSMVQAGEASGILPALLDRLATIREADEALLMRVKSAMTYPVLMLITMLGALSILFTLVVPKFAAMFEAMGQDLPPPTRILLDSSEFLQINGAWLVIGAAAIGVSLHQWSKTAPGRRLFDHWLLKLPLIGSFLTQVAMARLCRTLGTLLESGVNLLDALKNSQGVAGNQIIIEAVIHATKEVRAGKSLATTLEATGVFPSLVCEMIALGEESGQLGAMLLKVAAVYEQQMDELVKALTSVLEPMMILIMGLLVGFVVMAMLLPIFEMNLLA